LSYSRALQVASSQVEFSAFKDKHDLTITALEGTVYKLELENRQLERQLMILTNTDIKKVDASENRLVKLMAESGKVDQKSPQEATVGATTWRMHATMIVPG
jgi:hypothetical protein